MCSGEANMAVQFEVCQESGATEYRRKAILVAVDGGASTVK